MRHEQDIELQLARLVRGLEAVRRSPSRSAAMDRAVYVLLDRLGAGPRAAGQLATELHLDQSTVSRQLGALTRRGLARRVADPDGGRAGLLALTADGRRVLSAERAARAERVGHVLEGWDDGDREHLARLLARLNDAIDDRLAGLAEPSR